MTTQPLVSVLLATHNGLSFIREAIQSVLDQSYRNLELLIIDDASIENIEEIVQSFTDNRLKYYRLKNQHGLTKALNFGLKLARGKYIARIDDDDMWLDKDKLQNQIELMEEDSQLAVCGSRYIVIDESSQERFRMPVATSDDQIRKTVLQSNQFAHSAVCIRKEALDELGFYDERLKFSQDYELWLRLGTKYKLANLSDFAVAKRISYSGLTSRNQLKQFAAFFRTAFRYRQDYPGFYDNLPRYAKEFLLNLLLSKKNFYRLSALKRNFFQNKKPAKE